MFADGLHCGETFTSESALDQCLARLGIVLDAMESMGLELSIDKSYVLLRISGTAAPIADAPKHVLSNRTSLALMLKFPDSTSPHHACGSKQLRSIWGFGLITMCIRKAHDDHTHANCTSHISKTPTLALLKTHPAQIPFSDVVFMCFHVTGVWRFCC